MKAKMPRAQGNHNRALSMGNGRDLKEKWRQSHGRSSDHVPRSVPVDPGTLSKYFIFWFSVQQVQEGEARASFLSASGPISKEL